MKTTCLLSLIKSADYPGRVGLKPHWTSHIVPWTTESEEDAKWDEIGRVNAALDSSGDPNVWSVPDDYDYPDTDADLVSGRESYAKYDLKNRYQNVRGKAGIKEPHWSSKYVPWITDSEKAALNSMYAKERQAHNISREILPTPDYFSYMKDRDAQADRLFRLRNRIARRYVADDKFKESVDKYRDLAAKEPVKYMFPFDEATKYEYLDIVDREPPYWKGQKYVTDRLGPRAEDATAAMTAANKKSIGELASMMNDPAFATGLEDNMSKAFDPSTLSTNVSANTVSNAHVPANLYANVR